MKTTNLDGFWKVKYLVYKPEFYLEKGLCLIVENLTDYLFSQGFRMVTNGEGIEAEIAPEIQIDSITFQTNQALLRNLEQLGEYIKIDSLIWSDKFLNTIPEKVGE